MEIVTIIHEGIALATDPQNLFITLTPGTKRDPLSVASINEEIALAYIASFMEIDESRLLITFIKGEENGDVTIYLALNGLIGWHYLVTGEIG
jgi:hypothetical protein